MGEAMLRDAILATAVPRLSIAPSTLDLSGLELEVSQSRDRAFRLRAWPAQHRSRRAPPISPTCWSIVRRRSTCSPSTRSPPPMPSWCRCNASSSRSKDFRNCSRPIEQVKSTLNPGLTIHGIVLTMHDARNNLSNQVVADVRQNSREKVYDTIIPRNVRVSEAPSYGKPVLVYDLKCVGSEAYLRLATEIIQRERELLAGSASSGGDVAPDRQSGAA